MFRDIFNHTDMKHDHFAIDRQYNRIILHIHINLILDHILRHLVYPLIRLNLLQLQLHILLLADLKPARLQPLLNLLLLPLGQFLLMLFPPLVLIMRLQLNPPCATACVHRGTGFGFVCLGFGGGGWRGQVLQLVAHVLVFLVHGQGQDFGRLGG